MLQSQFEAARDLMRTGQWQHARRILESIPTRQAEEWLQKLAQAESLAQHQAAIPLRPDSALSMPVDDLSDLEFPVSVPHAPVVDLDDIDFPVSDDPVDDLNDVEFPVDEPRRQKPIPRRKTAASPHRQRNRGYALLFGLSLSCLALITFGLIFMSQQRATQMALAALQTESAGTRIALEQMLSVVTPASVQAEVIISQTPLPKSPVPTFTPTKVPPTTTFTPTPTISPTIAAAPLDTAANVCHPAHYCVQSPNQDWFTMYGAQPNLLVSNKGETFLTVEIVYSPIAAAMRDTTVRMEVMEANITNTGTPNGEASLIVMAGYDGVRQNFTSSGGAGVLAFLIAGDELEIVVIGLNQSGVWSANDETALMAFVNSLTIESSFDPLQIDNRDGGKNQRSNLTLDIPQQESFEVIQEIASDVSYDELAQWSDTPPLMISSVVGGVEDTYYYCPNHPVLSFTDAPLSRINDRPWQLLGMALITANLTAEIDASEEVIPLLGPACVDNYTWWQVRHGNIDGWVIVGDENGAFVIQRNVSSITCDGSLPTQFVANVGMLGIVLPGEANRLRAQPSVSAAQIGRLTADTVFDVFYGPICADGYAWWQVKHAGVIGWTVESDSREYWIAPTGE